jgi:hypothetical protein
MWVKQYNKPPHLLMVYTTHKNGDFEDGLYHYFHHMSHISKFSPMETEAFDGEAGAIEALVAAMKTHHADARVQSWAACPVASDLTLRRGCRQTFGMQKSMLNS